MHEFLKEVKARFQERKRKKHNTWVSLLIKIFALIFLVMVIKNLKTYSTSDGILQDRSKEIEIINEK